MKYFSQIVLGKELFASIKGHFCLTKGQLANVEEQVEIKFTSSEVIVDTIDLNQQNKNSKMTLFNKAFDLWMLYLSKTDSDR